MMYWKETKSTNEEKPNWYDSNKSADLEITAYVMLSKLFDLNKRELANIVPISRWITSNRNSLGGFYSTQDTVVALDALAEFARLTYVNNIGLKLSYYYNYNNNAPRSFLFINENNRLLLQKTTLDKFAKAGRNSLNFEVDGIGSVLVQVCQRKAAPIINLDLLSH